MIPIQAVLTGSAATKLYIYNVTVPSGKKSYLYGSLIYVNEEKKLEVNALQK